MSSCNSGRITRPSLFPSAGTSFTDEGSSKNLDWLENKSFTSDTAEKVVKFQKELGKLQKKSKSTDDSDDDDGSGGDGVKSRYHEAVSGDSGVKGLTFDLTQTVSDIHGVHKCTQRKEYDSADSEGYRYQKKKTKKKRNYSSSDDDEAGNYERKKKNKHKHKKKHKKEKQTRKKRNDTVIPGIFESKKVFLDDIEDIAPEHAFKLDRIPDHNSWTYGSLYNGHIAHYRPACNQCIGSARNQPLYLKDREKGKKDKISNERYHSKESRTLVKQPAKEVIRVAKEEKSNEVDMGNYIPVNQAKANEVDLQEKDVRQTILDDSTSLYVIGKGKNTEQLEMEEVRPDPMRLKVADYNKRLRETPSNVKLWLEFVRFQDKLVLVENEQVSVDDTEKGGKKPSARVVLEKNLSILDKALESNPADIDLLLAKIELESEVSDTFKMNKELEDLLFVHAANTKLWKFYLTFNQSRISSFSVTKMTKYYHKCFRTLLRILEGDVQTCSVPENLESEILDIFLQYCFFLKQTGYKEKAVATFQAMLEYNLFAPPSLVSKKIKMAEFEVFWDSNCPRIGAADASGWKNCIGKEVTGPAKNSSDSLEEIEDGITEKKLPKHDAWLEIESLREQHTWLPWQPGEGQTEDDCQDVERLVMFDDVSPVLFNVSEKLKIELVSSFLKFLGFPLGVDVLSTQVPPMCCEDVKNLTSYYQGSIKGDVVAVEDNEILRNLAVEVLRLAIPCFSGKIRSDLTICQIGIQLSKYNREGLSKSDKKEMKKLMKNLLKEEKNRNDLFIWLAYIDLERSIGKPGEGESVIETALTMYSGESVELVNESTVGLISLYCQYCVMLLHLDQKIPCKLLSRDSPVSSEIKKKVLSVVNCLVDSKKFNLKELKEISGAVTLKTMSTLARLSKSLFELVSEGTSDLSTEKFLKLVWCHCLFTYCKSGIASSLEIYSSVISLVSNSNKNRSDLEKRLHTDQLRLIVYHLSRSSSPLQLLRECLDTALRKFPDDPVFLSLFTDVERKSRISGRFNFYFDRWCRTLDAPTPAVIAVLTQLDFISDMTNSEYLSTSSTSGLVHRARSWLEQSLLHSNLQHCPLLWRLYFLIEKQVGDGNRLKGLFYRAIQQCPWNKSIYVDGVRMFGAEQLQEIVDLMTEKELRVQIPVEELDILMS
ncbi:nuclear exosome regulator NRDE2-like isoform X2 [Ruditapes philippinarum]|uniref:nuclear exosome regulator NRDE2-like isoform X2 n=1 Tax=Ruditapes philippinarum TaxID=129788 RepID=UPI00295B4E6E|nr:nuclear exosome regulator NRDE2-like isoform X2 [Ruditapes philippinarum]